MTNKTITIFISLILLAISFSLLLIFFIFSNQNSTINIPLSIQANDKVIKINEKQYNYFTISNENAQIQIYTDKPNIIEINKNYIKGLQLGCVKVTIKATLNKQNTQTTFQVNVINDGFIFEIIPISNCIITNTNHLNLLKNICQFSINIFDNYGNIVKNTKYNYTISDNATLLNEFDYFMIETTTDCKIILNYYEINLIIEIICYLL